MSGMVSKPCTVCGTSSRRVVARPEGSLFRCPECDHCFSDPDSMPEQETYGAEYYDEKHRAWFENPNTPLFDYLLAQIRRRVKRPDASVLDVGAGRGDLLAYLHRKEPTLVLTGIDLSPNPPREGITFLQGDVLELRTAQRFDAVLSLAVIEHVHDVRRFVRGLVEACAPEGLVVVMTLNDRSVLYWASRVMRRLGLSGPFDRLYEKHHVNHFNTRSLSRLMESAGLEVRALHLHNVPMAAVDLPAGSLPTRAIYRMGVWGTFVLGTLLRRTYLQTVVCTRRGAVTPVAP